MAWKLATFNNANQGLTLRQIICFKWKYAMVREPRWLQVIYSFGRSITSQQGVERMTTITGNYDHNLAELGVELFSVGDQKRPCCRKVESLIVEV